MTRKNTKGAAKCSFCKAAKRRPNQRTCRDCHAAYMRQSRLKAKEATR